MARLTFEGLFCDIAMCRENPCPYNGTCSQRETWERLKAYEDTGLEPEQCKQLIVEIVHGVGFDRIREIVQAEKDGRLTIRSKGSGHTCGECGNFLCKEGEKRGRCKARRFKADRYGLLTGEEFYPYRSRKACASEFVPREQAEKGLKGR